MAAPLKRAVPAAQFVSFLRLTDYSQGGFLPDGDYLLSDFSVVMYQIAKKDGTLVGAPTLNVRVTMEPAEGAKTDEEKKFQHYSMGRNAHLTYQPDPQTGKKLVLVPGGPSAPLYEATNFQILLKSLYDSGMPEDYAIDDLSSLDGIVAHITNIPEPESRKEFRSQQQTTGEMAAEPGKVRENKIPVVVEIKAAPWMEENAAPAAPPATIAKPKATPPAPKATLAATAPAVANGNGDLAREAENAIATYLIANPNGSAKLAMRMNVFKSLAANPPLQKGVVDTYFSDDLALSGILNPIGYKIEGPNVVLA